MLPIRAMVCRVLSSDCGPGCPVDPFGAAAGSLGGRSPLPQTPLIPLFGQEVAAWRCCRRLAQREGMKGKSDWGTDDFCLVPRVTSVQSEVSSRVQSSEWGWFVGILIGAWDWMVT